MDAQRIAVDAVVALTDCDRDAAIAFIRRLYLAGVKDPKRLTFKGLQAMTRGCELRRDTTEMKKPRLRSGALHLCRAFGGRPIPDCRSKP
jgi:hypothetical protein